MDLGKAAQRHNEATLQLLLLRKHGLVESEKRLTAELEALWWRMTPLERAYADGYLAGLHLGAPAGFGRSSAGSLTMRLVVRECGELGFDPRPIELESGDVLTCELMVINQASQQQRLSEIAAEIHTEKPGKYLWASFAKIRHCRSGVGLVR